MVRSLAIVALLAGCWTSRATPEAPIAEAAAQPAPPPPPPPPALTVPEVALQTMEDFSARMCACADMTCAEQVSKDMTAWSEDFAQSNPTGNADARLDEAQARRAADLGQRIGECMQRAVMPPPASTP